MRSSRGAVFLGVSAVALVVAAQAAGCGGNSANPTGTSTSSGGSSGGSNGGSKTTASSGHGGADGGTGGGAGGGAGGGTGEAVCGDGIVGGTEQCDLGAANGTAMGCDSSCQFDCATDSDCNLAGNLCPGTPTCVAVVTMGQMVKKCQAGTPLAQGASCGTNLYCVDMNCIPANCGDGVVEPPEECDNGGANGPGTGCENNCMFSCVAGDPTRDCSSTNTCVANGTCQSTHTCMPGADLINGTTCLTSGACQNGTCIVTSCAGQPACTACTSGLCSGSPEACNASTCGDGCVDPAHGEQCEPPNTATCGANCQWKPAVCGDGVIEVGEECDDGNLFDLDGCDSHCKYEVVTRMTAVAISGSPAPDALHCAHPANALGAKALTSAAISQLNQTLLTDVGDGTVNVMPQFLGLTDLTGVAATGFTIGVLDATYDPAKGRPSKNPIDAWFLANPSSVSMGLPTGLFTTASLANRVLTAGPNDVSLTLNLAGSTAPLTLLNAHLAGMINGNPAPDAPAPPPGALASGLVVFQTITADGIGQGLCGDIPVASLATIPIPETLAMGGGTAACAACPNSATYTYCGNGKPVGLGCNSLLDVIVGGCGVLPVSGKCIISAINPTQPDVASGATVAKLTLDATTHKVAEPTASDMDAYSTYLTFNANRAHFTGETCGMTSDCQTGKTCTSGLCK